MEQLLGSFAHDVQVGASSRVDYLKLLLCLVFLRSCTPRDWSELQNLVRSDANEIDLNELIRRIGHIADKTLRVYGPLPGMVTGLERLRLRSAKSLFDVIRLVDQLGPDAFDLLLDRFEVEAQVRSADFFTPTEVASLMVSLAVGEESMGRAVYDPYLRGGELLRAVESVRLDQRPQMVVGESPNRDTPRSNW